MTKTILITGSTDGLGKEVARRLAMQGHQVLLHGRDAEKGQALLEELRRASGNAGLRYYNADLASLACVQELAQSIQADHARLDVLVNNAGIGPRAPGAPRSISRDGFELFFAVNYLAGYCLARELLPLLKQSAPARLINVASIGQAPVNFADVMLTQDYEDALAYRQSKLAQILHAMDLAQELEGSGVTCNALHPATLMNTKMVHDSEYFAGSMTTIDDGANALEYLITSADLQSLSGRYFDGMGEAKADAQAYDALARERLRELSETLVAKALG